MGLSEAGGRSAFRRVVSWLPAAVLLLAVAGCWAAAFRGGLAGVVAWYALMLLVPLLGLALLLVCAGYAVWKRRLSLPLITTTLLALVAVWPLCWNFELLLVKYPVSIGRARPPAAGRLPADVPLRVAWGGDSLAVNYHASYPDQRWAYDLTVEPSFTGGARLEDYGCWGVPVVAPAAGRVVRAHDGEPDETPGAVSNNFDAPAGNHVVIELATGTYLEVAHLQRGSVSVKEGEAVEEGRPLGRCGNSGNTSEPHIHVHHQRQHPDFGEGILVEGLPLYFRDHDGPPMPEGGFKEEGGRAVPKGAVVRHVGARP
ncbi:MAG: M23 family metallopeptidase [Acidobacteria bacterium]|nr:M23 family metallopeptidase [Acidobacteriota bacterium]